MKRRTFPKEENSIPCKKTEPGEVFFFFFIKKKICKKKILEHGRRLANHRRSGCPQPIRFFDFSFKPDKYQKILIVPLLQSPWLLLRARACQNRDDFLQVQCGWNQGGANGLWTHVWCRL